MKKKSLLLIPIALLVIVSCSEKPKQTSLPAANTTTPAAPAKKEITLPAHTDDGKSYFAYMVTKGDSIVNNITSEKPIAFQGSKNIIIQLDSSHHLLVNGTGLNIYLNEKTDGKYQIASGSGKKEASILGGWLEQDETRTSYSVRAGSVNITRLVNDSCSGKFAGDFTLNGNDYKVKGEFLHVKIN